METKLILGISLFCLNIAVWFITGMMIWKNRKVDQYVYDEKAYILNI